MLPVEIEARLGVRFEPATDDLGPVLEALTLPAPLGPVLLSSRPDAPHAGVEVSIDAAATRDDCLQWLADGLGATEDRFFWVTPHERDPRAARTPTRDTGAHPAPLVLVIHGPAGAGKDALTNRLLESGRFAKAVSTTSRPPRPGEREGIDYYFLPGEGAFRAKVAEDAFAEWFWVHGQGKGLYWSELRRLLDSGTNVLIKTDVNGARHWRETLPGAIDILILPEDPDASLATHRAVLHDRILKREPGIAPAELAQRLDDAEAEVIDAPNADYILVNRDGALHEAERALDAIIEGALRDASRPAATRRG
jgi:guanylate kinase